jgi:hypothetical protein
VPPERDVESCGGRGGSVDSPEEWPMPKRVLRRRQRKALFEIERVFWEEGFSELLYDAACEVFLNREGRVVLSRHYAHPKLLER